MTKFTGFSIFLSIGLSMHIATLCAQDLVLKVNRQDSCLIYQQYITPGDTIKQGTYYKYIAAGKGLNEGGFYKNYLKDSTWQVYDCDSKTVIEKYNYKSGIKEGRSSYFNLNGKEGVDWT